MSNDAPLGGSAEPVAPPLLPCPFCGCEGVAVEMDGAWVAGCDAGQTRADDDMTCRANGIGFYHRTRAGAIAAWNRRALARAPQGDPPEPGALRAAYREIAEAACDLPIMGVMPADQYREPESGYVRSRRPTDPLPDAPPASVERFQLALHRLHVLVSGVPAPQGDAAPRDLLTREATRVVLLRLWEDGYGRGQHAPATWSERDQAVDDALAKVLRGGASSSGSAPTGESGAGVAEAGR